MLILKWAYSNLHFILLNAFVYFVLLVHELIENEVGRIPYDSAETPHARRVGNTEISGKKF